MGTFEMGRYPVTVAEYQRFFEDGGYQVERWWKAGGFGSRKKPDRWEEQIQHPNRPVTNVSWYEAAAYAAWAGARLPREAEWEFAARGMERREFPWGNERPDATRANYVGKGPAHPTPVGLYAAGETPEGILDMGGNIWEWVDDWYDDNKTTRVLRGGSFGSYEEYLQAAGRFNSETEVRSNNVGFRCVRESEIP